MLYKSRFGFFLLLHYYLRVFKFDHILLISEANNLLKPSLIFNLSNVQYK